PALHPTIQVLRRRPHHRLRPERTHLLLQPRPPVPPPPPAQNPRQLVVRTGRTPGIPLAKPAGALLPPRRRPPRYV
ncbi:hypothetical protein PD653B2_4544, partial [Nocardioides sp. PD653-B2]